MNEPTSSNWTRGSTFSVFKFAGRPTHRRGLTPQLSFAKSELGPELLETLPCLFLVGASTCKQTFNFDDGPSTRSHLGSRLFRLGLCCSGFVSLVPAWSSSGPSAHRRMAYHALPLRIIQAACPQGSKKGLSMQPPFLGGMCGPSGPERVERGRRGEGRDVGFAGLECPPQAPPPPTTLILFLASAGICLRRSCECKRRTGFI